MDRLISKVDDEEEKEEEEEKDFKKIHSPVFQQNNNFLNSFCSVATFCSHKRILAYDRVRESVLINQKTTEVSEAVQASRTFSEENSCCRLFPIKKYFTSDKVSIENILYNEVSKEDISRQG